MCSEQARSMTSAKFRRASVTETGTAFDMYILCHETSCCTGVGTAAHRSYTLNGTKSRLVGDPERSWACGCREPIPQVTGPVSAPGRTRPLAPPVVPYVRGEDDAVPAGGPEGGSQAGCCRARRIRGRDHPRVDSSVGRRCSSSPSWWTVCERAADRPRCRRDARRLRGALNGAGSHRGHERPAGVLRCLGA